MTAKIKGKTQRSDRGKNIKERQIKVQRGRKREIEKEIQSTTEKDRQHENGRKETHLKNSVGRKREEYEKDSEIQGDRANKLSGEVEGETEERHRPKRTEEKLLRD